MRPRIISLRPPQASAFLLAFQAVALVPTTDAQGAWNATLFIDPYPSPYLSDWEINPNISSLTLINGTGATQSATAVYRVANSAGIVLATGRSDPQLVPPDVPQTYTSFVDMAGTSWHDPATEDEMVRTGRLPEGVYHACVTIADANSFVVAETCADFTILYPDPPLLIAPGNGEVIETDAPFLQWTPMQVPAQFQLRYVLQIAEVQSNQTPDEALNGPVPHYVNPDVGTTNLQYPLDAPPLQDGRVYAWRVIALDQNGYAAASNGGASETYVFRYATAATRSPGQSVITLSMSNAFDHEPDDGTVGVRANTITSRGIDELCENWSQPAGDFVMTTNSPVGFRRFAGNAAELYQDDAERTWWIKTTSPNGRRDVLIAGACDRFNDKTRIHWIASKNETLQQRISDVLSSPVIQALPGPDVANVNYSMVVLSKGSHTVSVPDEFAAGVEFLGDRELDVAMGLNLYSEIDLEQFALWPFFQSLGFTEKRITLYGFLGWDASWSAGMTLGSDDPQVDLSTEHTFLVLRAMLPRREPVGFFKDKIQAHEFELEVTLGDSTGRAWTDSLRPTTSASLELIPRAIHRIVVNDNLTIEGSVGLDFARGMKHGLPLEGAIRLTQYVRGKASTLEQPDYTAHVLISYGANGKLPLGKRGNVQLEALEAILKFPVDAPDSEQEFMLKGEFGIAGQEGVAVLGAAFKHVNVAALHNALAKAQKARYEAGTKLSASETGECVDGATVSPQKAKWCKIDASIKALQKQLTEVNASPDDKSKKTSDWTWKVRASVGHLSIGELLALIKEG